MKLNLTQEEKKALLAYLEAGEDCEKLSEKEWVMDLYQGEKPISLDLVFNGKSVFADGAEYLKYDEEMDGWYIAGRWKPPKRCWIFCGRRGPWENERRRERMERVNRAKRAMEAALEFMCPGQTGPEVAARLLRRYGSPGALIEAGKHQLMRQGLSENNALC